MFLMLATMFSLAFAQEKAGLDGDYLQLETGEVAPAEWSTVDFQVDRDGMKVATILGTTVASSGGYTATATTYQDLCMTPCRLAIRPGIRKFQMYGAGRTPGGVEVDLRRGKTHVVEMQTGSRALFTVGYYGMLIGLSSALTGGILLAVDPSNEVGLGDTGVPLLGAGAALAGAGIPMFVFGRSKVSQRSE